MRNVTLLGTRLVVGSYMAVHGAQKLFGAFGGPGLEKAGVGPGKFRIGPSLPRPLAVAATVGGGLLAAGLVAKMLTAAPAAPATPASQAESAGQAQSAGQAESAGQASPLTTAPAGIPGNPRPA